MREEVLGIEDSFKFCSYVMNGYAKVEVEGRDNSVELYLLNHWSKDFSLRDLIDRVASSSVVDEKFFPVLFKWLSANRLQGNTDWVIEDFRKLALFMTKNLRDIMVTDFFVNAVDKLG